MLLLPRWVITYSSSQCHAPGRQLAVVRNASCHHAEFAPLNKGLEVLDLLTEGRLLLVLLGVGVGGLVAGICVAERHLGFVSVGCRGLKVSVVKLWYLSEA